MNGWSEQRHHFRVMRSERIGGKNALPPCAICDAPPMTWLAPIERAFAFIAPPSEGYEGAHCLEIKAQFSRQLGRPGIRFGSQCPLDDHPRARLYPDCHGFLMARGVGFYHREQNENKVPRDHIARNEEKGPQPRERPGASDG